MSEDEKIFPEGGGQRKRKPSQETSLPPSDKEEHGGKRERNLQLDQTAECSQPSDVQGAGSSSSSAAPVASTTPGSGSSLAPRGRDESHSLTVVHLDEEEILNHEEIDTENIIKEIRQMLVRERIQLTKFSKMVLGSGSRSHVLRLTPPPSPPWKDLKERDLENFVRIRKWLDGPQKDESISYLRKITQKKKSACGKIFNYFLITGKKIFSPEEIRSQFSKDMLDRMEMIARINRYGIPMKKFDELVQDWKMPRSQIIYCERMFRKMLEDEQRKKGKSKLVSDEKEGGERKRDLRRDNSAEYSPQSRDVEQAGPSSRSAAPVAPTTSGSTLAQSGRDESQSLTVVHLDEEEILNHEEIDTEKILKQICQILDREDVYKTKFAAGVLGDISLKAMLTRPPTPWNDLKEQDLNVFVRLRKWLDGPQMSKSISYLRGISNQRPSSRGKVFNHFLITHKKVFSTEEIRSQFSKDMLDKMETTARIEVFGIPMAKFDVLVQDWKMPRSQIIYCERMFRKKLKEEQTKKEKIKKTSLLDAQSLTVVNLDEEEILNHERIDTENLVKQIRQILNFEDIHASKFYEGVLGDLSRKRVLDTPPPPWNDLKEQDLGKFVRMKIWLEGPQRDKSISYLRGISSKNESHRGKVFNHFLITRKKVFSPEEIRSKFSHDMLERMDTIARIEYNGIPMVTFDEMVHDWQIPRSQIIYWERMHRKVLAEEQQRNEEMKKGRRNTKKAKQGK